MEIGELFYIKYDTFISPKAKKIKNRTLGFYLPIFRAFCLYLLVLFSIAFIISFFISPVSAGQTMNSSVNLSGITDTTLSFEVFYKTDIRPTGATLDGIEIEGFDLFHNVTYVAKDLQPNTTHTFCIYKDLINCETGTTKQSTTNYIIDTFGKWLMLIIVVILIFIGINVPFFDIIAFVFAIFPFLQALTTGDIWFVIIWTCCLLASMFAGYYGMKHKG